MIESCCNNLSVEESIRIINPKSNVSLRELSFLDIDKIEKKYFNAVNKELLKERLNSLNDKIVNLKNKLSKLSKENHEKTKEKQEEQRRFEKGIEFRDPNDDKKLITVKPLDDSIEYSDPHDYDINKVKSKDNILNIENESMFVVIGDILFNLFISYPEYFLGCFICLLLIIANSFCNKRRIRKIKDNSKSN